MSNEVKLNLNLDIGGILSGTAQIELDFSKLTAQTNTRLRRVMREGIVDSRNGLIRGLYGYLCRQYDWPEVRFSNATFRIRGMTGPHSRVLYEELIAWTGLAGSDKDSLPVRAGPEGLIHCYGVPDKFTAAKFAQVVQPHIAKYRRPEDVDELVQLIRQKRILHVTAKISS